MSPAGVPTARAMAKINSTLRWQLKVISTLACTARTYNAYQQKITTQTNASLLAPLKAESSALRTFGEASVPTSSHPPVTLPLAAPTPHQRHPQLFDTISNFKLCVLP